MRSDGKKERVEIGLLTCVFAAITIFLPAAWSVSSAEEPKARGEYEIKAALVYNFLKFVEWPSKAVGGDLRICVLGELLHARPIVGLDNQTVAGRRLAVEQADPQDFIGCDVLFLLKGEERRLAKFQQMLEGKSVLTIGEAEGLAGKGVMINFLIVQKKVRFEINADAARGAGILMSAKLLKLASRVYDSRAGGE